MLTSAHPSFTVVKPGPDKHPLISVCIHGNETCGLLAFNELLQASAVPPLCLPDCKCWLKFQLVCFRTVFRKGRRI